VLFTRLRKNCIVNIYYNSLNERVVTFHRWNNLVLGDVAPSCKNRDMISCWWNATMHVKIDGLWSLIVDIFSYWIEVSLCWKQYPQPRSQGFRVRTRGETRKPWSGPITWLQNMDIFDSYSSRNGEIFLAEIYKYSKQINSQKTSQSILFMCSEVWHELAEISKGTVDVF
jgi:hypothetical protein